MVSELYKQINYSADIKYLISTYIYEYDISKANINILFNKGVLDEYQYNNLYQVDRLTRQISIGLLLKDNPQISQVLKDGIIEAKKMFFEANNIQDHEVLFIKNDAVFLINKLANARAFGNIEFVNKNIYTSFYQIGKLSLLYYLNQQTGIENLDVKGISDDRLSIHNNYFLEFLKVLFSSAEACDMQETIEILTTFYNNYISLSLEIGYYRRFDPESFYVFKQLSQFHSYKADILPEETKPNIDISYNLQILRDLHQIYSGLFFSRR